MVMKSESQFRQGTGKAFLQAVACLACLFCMAGLAHAWDAYIVQVEDGNTLSVTRTKGDTANTRILRFYGVDAPALNQPCGQQALDFLNNMLPKGEKVTVDPVGTDENGIERALVQVGGTSINYQLLREGLAWVNRNTCKAMFCRRWHIQEHQAIEEKRGIWAIQHSTPPWQWGR